MMKYSFQTSLCSAFMLKHKIETVFKIIIMKIYFGYILRFRLCSIKMFTISVCPSLEATNKTGFFFNYKETKVLTPSDKVDLR